MTIEQYRQQLIIFANRGHRHPDWAVNTTFRRSVAALFRHDRNNEHYADYLKWIEAGRPKD